MALKGVIEKGAPKTRLRLPVRLPALVPGPCTMSVYPVDVAVMSRCKCPCTRSLYQGPCTRSVYQSVYRVLRLGVLGAHSRSSHLCLTAIYTNTYIYIYIYIHIYIYMGKKIYDPTEKWLEHGMRFLFYFSPPNDL